MVSANREPLTGFLAIVAEVGEEGQISTVVVSDLRLCLPFISSSFSPSSPFTLGVEAIYVLLRPLTFVSMEAVEMDVSRGVGHPLIGSGDECTVRGVSGPEDEIAEDDIEVDVDVETVVEEKLVLRGMRSREDDGLGGLGGGWYRCCDGLGEVW
jgi:hypothetical protein